MINEKQQLRDILLKDLDLSFQDISDITGLTYGSVKVMLRPSSECPKWLKLVIYAWENKKS